MKIKKLLTIALIVCTSAFVLAGSAHAELIWDGHAHPTSATTSR